jgi:probable non-F420 flavinoid oxidoreductase
MIIGYHASHEQFTPRELLRYAKAAEDGGFGAVMTSDHIAPWSVRQANSGNNWAWLGAALAQTSEISFGSLAIPGGWRYHPTVLAHLIATLSEMFPGRVPWIALGSGEALNEMVVGEGWPEKEERNERLKTAAGIIRDLLRGETVTAHHPWFDVDEAKLWSLPPQPPALFGAALTAKTAAWLGSWADGLITIRKPKDELMEMVAAFRNNGGAGKPMALQLQLSWAATRDEARQIAWQQWRNAAATPDKLADLRRPEDFDKVTDDVTPEQMEDVMPLITQADELLAVIEEYRPCGFGELYIHNVSRDQEGFIQFMAREVLPALRQA